MWLKFFKVKCESIEVEVLLTPVFFEYPNTLKNQHSLRSAYVETTFKTKIIKIV